jgi:hypothetical protein
MKIKSPNNEAKRSWLKRVGWIGFFFFLIKGLFWLAMFLFAGNEVFKTCN